MKESQRELSLSEYWAELKARDAKAAGGGASWSPAASSASSGGAGYGLRLIDGVEDSAAGVGNPAGSAVFSTEHIMRVMRILSGLESE